LYVEKKKDASNGRETQVRKCLKSRMSRLGQDTIEVEVKYWRNPKNKIPKSEIEYEIKQ
jgi:hypothetical protein